MKFNHISVLLNESIDLLNINPDGVYVDGTLGGGGHAELVCRNLKNGRLIGIDQDSEAIAAATERLKPFAERVTIVRDNFRNIKDILFDLEIDSIDGAILDLGVSSHQLDMKERGFSYNTDAPLDMRMNTESSKSAKLVINTYSEAELAKVIFDYGEERFARRIARKIIQRRENEPIETTFELVDIIKSAVPGGKYADKHPAKRTFQAIRIEVNDEIELLQQAIYDFFDSLTVGGRLCIISFHSLEDRIVKQVFAELCKGCTCPGDFPICVCGKTPKGKGITRKPISAGEDELTANNRAHSAKLRCIEKTIDNAQLW